MEGGDEGEVGGGSGEVLYYKRHCGFYSDGGRWVWIPNQGKLTSGKRGFASIAATGRFSGVCSVLGH